MAKSNKLRVVLVKPSKYGTDGYVERFRWGFMPNSTLPYMASLTPCMVDGASVETHCVDEYVHTDLDYVRLLTRADGENTLVAFVGVQSHQFHRALDLAAFARQFGCHTVIGGPHAMTCDTRTAQGTGTAFALAEAERIWEEILRDAVAGELQAVYGADGRWAERLDPPTILPPSRSDLSRHVVPMLGIYPARGCPFSCTFCSVVKIAGHRIRSQPVVTTIDSLKAAATAGVKVVMFTSDNFNKYPGAAELMNAMIEEKINVRFMVQCDTQVGRQEELVERMGRAGCHQMFVGAESFNKQTLKEMHKIQNRPDTYQRIVDLCRMNGIDSHFSNIIGFPADTQAGIAEHMDQLQALAPVWASFYVLCPIPGTEQYDQFRADGLIRERNLDRFDTTSLTWDHPNLSAPELEKLLFDCYKRFYSVRHAVDGARAARACRYLRTASAMGRESGFSESAAIAVGTFFQRYCAAHRMHPMSGGLKKVRLDADRDYQALRRRTYGFDLAPLPDSLRLPEAAPVVLRRELTLPMAAKPQLAVAA